MTTKVPHAMTEGIYSASQVDALISGLKPIGSVVLRMDDVDPATIFGGIWELIVGDATLSFGDGSIRDGAVIGANTHTLTIEQTPSHAHGSSALTFAGNALGEHTHPYSFRGTGDQGSDSGSALRVQVATTGGTTGGATAGTPTGNISGTTDSNGTGEDHNIQSARILVNIWHRTA